MNATVKKVLERVAAWPEEDQEELASLAREIEARRTAVYVLSEDGQAAIDAARRSGLASDGEVAAFWSRYGFE
jgi:ParB-like chromosome segregation protein Spo0J